MTGAASPAGRAHTAPAPTAAPAARGASGGRDGLDGRAAARLLAPLADRVHRPGDPAYRDALRLWNTRTAAEPAAVVRPATADEAARAVLAAREAGLEPSVRGGGHHVAGGAVRTDGVVVDMRGLDRVVLDPGTGRVTAGAGATWRDVAAATVPYGRAVPTGNAPSTGVVGVALGGGIGVFTRAWGLTCDRVVRVGLVDPEGRRRDVGPDRDPDLFWLARGAGRGIGVVTEIEFDTRPVAPEIATAQAFYPLSDAVDVLEAFARAVGASPDQVSPQATLRRLPDSAGLPPALRGRWLVAVGAAYAGPPHEAGPVLEPFRRLGEPVADLSGDHPVQEPAQPWRSTLRAHSFGAFLDALGPATVRTIAAAFGGGRPPGASVTLRSMGGAAAEADDDATAFAHRRARFLLTAQAEWDDPRDDEACTAWCEALERSVRSEGATGVYGNFCADLEGFAARRADAYGATDRIDAILRRHDPDGVFRGMAMRP
ncbi:FAD-binding oxidoreductase [Nocardiopsis sp. RSe5-2]|uniref:FAD-binding oxidoreductase n=1 Tax=Nocardiopsis endophytica TaxID=3018445 RepID=A0ABT4U3A2_9ACTN|nr:FAD-binding oxidoreductase [Nocardiopsis endophytica]MDA2810920.1 FAD-binding oxidoreductase [Nocardiopsis endophytica]